MMPASRIRIITSILVNLAIIFKLFIQNYLKKQVLQIIVVQVVQVVQVIHDLQDLQDLQYLQDLHDLQDLQNLQDFIYFYLLPFVFYLK